MLGFLIFWYKLPVLTVKGFFLCVAKVHYGTSLSNVDWLHGGAESLLTLTNLFIVLGLRQALRKANNAKESAANVVSDRKDEKTPSIYFLGSVKLVR